MQQNWFFTYDKFHECGTNLLLILHKTGIMN